MTLIIAGERSGVGKTTITLAILSYLAAKKYSVQSFKVGPDYIDPMFHSQITDRPCRNLDPVLTSSNYVKSCYTRHCQNVKYALIEGVMGLFDGIKKEEIAEFASTAHIARILDLPVLLVIDCSRLSGSVAAIAYGYANLDPRVKIAGLILNRVASDRHLELLQNALEPLQIPILGILRRQNDIIIPDRHLGLVPSAEIQQLNTIFDRLANLAENCFNWEQLLPLLRSEDEVETYHGTSVRGLEVVNKKDDRPKLKIAVARDRAFNFYYQDNLDILVDNGAELVFWSPLSDRDLPPGVTGLYFGGGFPEIFAELLAENKPAKNAVKNAILAGMPTIAECGGLMYLCRQISDLDGKNWQMVGILPTDAIMTKKLTLGYRHLTALEDSLLFRTGEKISGHEFHYSQLSHLCDKPLFTTSRSTNSCTGWQLKNLYASYIHLHFGEYPLYLRRFLHHCFIFSSVTG